MVCYWSHYALCIFCECGLTICRRRLFGFRVRHRTAVHVSPTNSASPVIVAENMIGVAMYELVCKMDESCGTNADGCRSVSVTRTWSARSFESTMTRPPSRSTRRLVRNVQKLLRLY
jgi:hypothetical protein